MKILYYPPAGPNRVTIFRDFAILLPTRWLFGKTIFHFHASGLSEIYERLPAWQRWLFRRAYYNADAGIRLSALTPDDARQLRVRREYVIANGIDDPCPAGPMADTTPISARTSVANPVRGDAARIEGRAGLDRGRGTIGPARVPLQVEIMGQFITPEFESRVTPACKSWACRIE